MRDRCVWHVRRPLDVARMQRRRRLLVGAPRLRRLPRRRLRAQDDRAHGPPPDGRAATAELVTIDVEADAFLKNMVRILVGTLVDVGRGRLRPTDVRRACSTAATAARPA